MDFVFDKLDHIDASDADVIVFETNIDRDTKHALKQKSAVIAHRDLPSVNTATNEDDTRADISPPGFHFKALSLRNKCMVGNLRQMQKLM